MMLRHIILLIALVVPFSTLANSAQNSLDLHINQNRIISVNEDIQDIFVSDPSVLVVHAPSSRHVMLSGKALGETDVLLLGGGAKTLAHYQVAVSADLSDLQRSVRHAFPEADVHFAYSKGTIIVMGEVANAL